MRPIVDLLKFPDRDVQHVATIAVNCICLGLEQSTKASVMTEKGLEPLIDLVNGDDIEVVSATIYALGSLAENDDVKAKLVELSAVEAVIKQMLIGDIEIKRASG